MRKNTIPTLSLDGYVTDPEAMMNYMFSHMFEIRYDDSYIYKDEVMSMQKIVADYGHDETLYKNELTSRLTNYFRRVFDAVEVNLTIKDMDSGYFNMDVDIVVTKNNNQYSLGRSLQVSPTEQTAKIMS